MSSKRVTGCYAVGNKFRLNVRTDSPVLGRISDYQTRRSTVLMRTDYE